MKARFAPSFIAIATLVAAAFVAEPANRVLAASDLGASQNGAAIEGVWRAQIRGLPALTLNITYESGSLNGAILFYLLRKEPGQTETASPGVPEPLMNPQFDGKVLTFAVSHHRAHRDSSKADPPVQFSVTLSGADRADLIRENDAASKVEMQRD
jgi:hypothetical protein